MVVDEDHAGHNLVAVGNLQPPVEEGRDELDSFMFQTVGWNVIEAYSECLGLPLYRNELGGRSVHQELSYRPTDHDEVEDLYQLLLQVKENHPEINAVASGAILSTYQRNRVENVYV